MVIEVMDTVEWSRLSWDMSWEKTADLESLLPQIGRTYELPKHFSYPLNRQLPNEGTAHIVWKPPHSDLNGWDDKRPSEILKSYVIEGEIKIPVPITADEMTTRLRNTEWFEFTVTDRERLTGAFERLDETGDVVFLNSPHSLGWHKAGQLKRAGWQVYLYFWWGWRNLAGSYRFES